MTRTRRLAENADQATTSFLSKRPIYRRGLDDISVYYVEIWSEVTGVRIDRGRVFRRFLATLGGFGGHSPRRGGPLCHIQWHMAKLHRPIKIPGVSAQNISP
jgi:hypothetical protein